MVAIKNITVTILSKLGNRLSPYIRKAKKLFNINIEYPYTNFSITLPADHMLPTHQRYHKKYDRFLSHLCKYIEAQATVIDVGANCGDTLAGMFDANDKLTYICIEPDSYFFNFLQKNVSRIQRYNKEASIITVKSLVGKSIKNAVLEGVSGTKHAVIKEDKDSIPSQMLDDILAKTSNSEVRLFKSDVDGFDYDVIDSAEFVLSTQHPIVFFECQYDYEFQKSGYKETISSLKKKRL